MDKYVDIIETNGFSFLYKFQWLKPAIQCTLQNQ